MLEVLGLLITGGLAGWAAGTLIRGSGYGAVINIVLGIVGGVVGAKLFSALGLTTNGWLVELGMAVVGAVILLSLVGLLRRVAG